MEELLPQAPENYRQILKRSLILYCKSFKAVYLLALALSVIAFLPRYLSLLIGEHIFYDLQHFDFNRLWLFAINLIAVMLFLSLFWRIHGVIDHLHESIKEDLLFGIKKLFKFFIAALIQALIIFAVFVMILSTEKYLQIYFSNSSGFWSIFLVTLILFIQLLILLYIYTLFVFLAPLIVLENKGIFSALQKSVSLVWNHWWRTFSVQITPWIIYVFVLITLNKIFNFQIYVIFFSKPSPYIWANLIHMFTFSFYIPWVAALLVVQLKDLELRKAIAATKKHA